MNRETRADITFERLSSMTVISFQINFISAIPLVGEKKKKKKKESALLALDSLLSHYHHLWTNCEYINKTNILKHELTSLEQ